MEKSLKETIVDNAVTEFNNVVRNLIEDVTDSTLHFMPKQNYNKVEYYDLQLSILKEAEIEIKFGRAVISGSLNEVQHLVEIMNVEFARLPIYLSSFIQKAKDRGFTTKDERYFKIVAYLEECRSNGEINIFDVDRSNVVKNKGLGEMDLLTKQESTLHKLSQIFPIEKNLTDHPIGELEGKGDKRL